MKITAQTDSINRFTKQCSSYTVPESLGFQCRVSSLHKRRSTAQSHREQIRMQTKLMHRYIYTCTKSCFITGKYTFNQTIKAKFLESAVVRLYTHPAVIIEYIGFLAILMYHIN